MKGFLAVSAAPGAAPTPTLAPHPRAVRYLHGADTAAVHRTDDGWLAFTGPDADDAATDPARGFTVRLAKSTRTRSGDVHMAALAAILGDGSRVDGARLADLIPPSAAAHRAGPAGPLVLAGDWFGMRQLFWWQGDGLAAVSTSALALAALAQATPDTRALQIQSLIGWQVGLGTLFAGVTKLAPGSYALLHAGRVTVRTYDPGLVAEAADAADGGGALAEMVEILRDLLTGYVGDHPESVLQLTGGQDSRILLAAVPPKLRVGLRALTLDVHGGPEHGIAAQLSELCGLDHHVHWLDEQPAVDPATAYQMVLDASTALDGMASPLALAPLALAESLLEQGHRLSGLGGETARGFYYVGQPRRAQTSPRLVSRLAEWRLFANEAVVDEALEPDFVADARPAVLAAVNAAFEGYSRDWLRATDQFYLYQRMHRWAGAHGGVAAVNRFFVNPMLDRRFVELAHATAPADKRDSRLLGLLTDALDPQLAAIPLDSGLVPARLARGGASARVAVARITAVKVLGKVRQRLRNARPAQLGAGEMARLVVRHWRAEPDLVAPLRAAGPVRAAWLDELLDGHRDAPPATVAFLVNLLTASRVEHDRLAPTLAVRDSDG